MSIQSIGIDRTDPVEAADDAVVRLRQRGTRMTHDLLAVAASEPSEDGSWLVGAADGCPLRLIDPGRSVAPHHAHLVGHGEGGWTLVGDPSGDGLRVDGTKRLIVPLEAGMEVGLGGLALVAESRRSAKLFSFLERILAGNGKGCEGVDDALGELRAARRKLLPLVLRGEGDLLPVAVELHRRAVGRDRPFIACGGPRRGDGAAPPDLGCRTAGEAFARAAGGTLCIRSERPPADHKQILEFLRRSAGDPPLVVICDSGMRKREPLLHRSIRIPPLRSRLDQLPYIVEGYALDASRELGLPPVIRPEDRDWVIRHSASSLAEIAKGTMRLAALRAEGTVDGAAERLEIPVASLRDWINRREVPSFWYSAREPGPGTSGGMQWRRGFASC